MVRTNPGARARLDWSETGSWKRQCPNARRQHERHLGREMDCDQVAPTTRIIEDDLSHLAFCEIV